MRRYYKRAFLNKPGFESTGLVLAEAKMTSDGLEADLSIADCTRKMTLAFSVYTDSDGSLGSHTGIAKNVRFKAELLRKSVNEFVDTVIAGLDELESR